MKKQKGLCCERFTFSKISQKRDLQPLNWCLKTAKYKLEIQKVVHFLITHSKKKKKNLCHRSMFCIAGISIIQHFTQYTLVVFFFFFLHKNICIMCSNKLL